MTDCPWSDWPELTQAPTPDSDWLDALADTELPLVDGTPDSDWLEALADPDLDWLETLAEPVLPPLDNPPALYGGGWVPLPPGSHRPAHSRPHRSQRAYLGIYYWPPKRTVYLRRRVGDRAEFRKVLRRLREAHPGLLTVCRLERILDGGPALHRFDQLFRAGVLSRLRGVSDFRLNGETTFEELREAFLPYLEWPEL